MDKITGYYLDGKTSKRHNAFLSPPLGHSAVIRINVDAAPIFLDVSAIKISSRLGNTPREIAWGDEQLFVTDNNDAIDAFIKQLGLSKRGNKLHFLESKLSLVFISTILAVVLLASFIVYGIPASAKYVANILPSQQFTGGLAILDKTLFEPTQLSINKQKHIQQLAKPFLSNYTALNASLHFRSGMPANAMVLPAGEIIFTDDFVNLAENDEELLAILFHEIGHLKHKHTTRRLLQGSMVTLLIILLTGDVDSLELLTGLPTLLLDLSYSREFENEADDFAFQLMAKNAIEIYHFSNMMTKLQAVYNDDTKQGVDEKAPFSPPSFLSTHPETKERIHRANQFEKNIGLNP